MAEIRLIDSSAIDQLGKDIVAAKNELLGKLAERGFALLRREVPYQTTNLRQGVALPDVTPVGVRRTVSENKEGTTTVDFLQMEAVLTVSARSGARGGGVAEVFGKDGKPTGRKVSLRPSPAFNYAEAVARGRAAIRPKTAKALLIPLATAPSGEGYLLVGGQVYVVRRSAAAVPANPYDERAASRLENEAPNIADAVLRKFV